MAQLFQADIEKRGLVLDPRTKLFVMLTTVLFVIGGSGVIPNWLITGLAVFPVLLLCTARQWKKAAVYGAVFIVAQWYLQFFMGDGHAGGSYLFTMLCVIIVRILPGLIMGAYLFSSTTVSEFIAAMGKMHVSNKISIPMSVMFRFFPTVMEEFHAINCAMRMRDIRIGGKNVMKMLEYRIVPLLVCSVNIGNELSAASLTRGLSADAKRTNICKIGFHIQDSIVFLIMIVPYVWVIKYKIGA